MSYVVPEYNKKSFNCPHCGTLAEQKWIFCDIWRDEIESQYLLNIIYSDEVEEYSVDERYNKRLAVSTCNACHKEHIWLQNEMILPRVTNVPMPIEGMPEKVKNIYNEAREVFPVSAKAATALLRLALQHLCVELGGTGENINNDIKKLVANGLSVKIQQALDVVRVAGNNAVRPGVLNLEDDKTSASYLFEILNIIVDNQIIQPKKIDEFYNALPQKALDGIKNRDK